MDRDETESKAEELYEKVWRWIEWQPEDEKRGRGFDVIKTHNRIEVIKAIGALEVNVEAPDHLSVRAPLESPKDLSEREMLDAVKRWLGFAAYP